MSKPDIRFKLDDKLVELRLDELTFEEIELLEDAFDAPISQVNLERAKALRILAFIALRRKDSRLRMSDLEKLPIEALQEVEDEPEPTVDAARPTPPASKRKAAKAA